VKIFSPTPTFGLVDKKTSNQEPASMRLLTCTVSGMRKFVASSPDLELLFEVIGRFSVFVHFNICHQQVVNCN